MGTDMGRGTAQAAGAAGVVASSGEGISAVDRLGTITVWNNAAARCYGVPAANTLGRRLDAVVADPQTRERCARALAGETLRYDRVWVRPDGTRAVLAVTLSPLLDEAGATAGAVAVTRDITAVRAAEDARLRTLRQADFLARATHLLARSLEAEQAAASLIDLLVPEFADLALLRILARGGRSLEVVHLAHTVPGKQRLAERYARRTQAAGSGAPIWRVMADGAPLWVEHLGADELKTLDDAPDRRALLDALGTTSVVMVPLYAGQRPLGALTLAITEGERAFDRHDLDFAVQIADRAAQAFANTQLFEAERSARRRAQEHDAAAQAADARFHAAFDHAPVGMALVDLDGEDAFRLREVNGGLCALSGLDRPALAGLDVRELLHPDERPRVDAELAALADGEAAPPAIECRLRADGLGAVRWVQIRAGLLVDGTTAGRRAVLQLQDTTERRHYEDQLQHLADHDALTGLFNRRRFNQELERVVHEVDRFGEGAAVVAIDLDDFKDVNDTYGHAVGDAVLRAVADAIRARARITDVLARVGGDEFCLLLLRIGRPEADHVVAEVLRSIRAITAVRVGERLVRPTASAGLRWFGPGSARNIDEILLDADMAMYDAKEGGRDRLSVADDGPAAAPSGG